VGAGESGKSARIGANQGERALAVHQASVQIACVQTIVPQLAGAGERARDAGLAR
jgi:hypothetical protein